RWPGSAANTTGCSETDTAPDRPSSTAHSNPSVKPARSSKPASRSDPPSKPNTTTPPTKDKPTARNSSTNYSATSTTAKHHEPLDTDHPHNAAKSASYRRESDESARHVDRICLCGHRLRRGRWCRGTDDRQWRSKMTATLKMTHKT